MTLLTSAAFSLSSTYGHGLVLILILISCRTHALMTTKSAIAIHPRAFVRGVVHPTSHIISTSTTPIQNPLGESSSLSSSSLPLFPSDGASLVLATTTISSPQGIMEEDASAMKAFAEALGYLIGAASLLLYTPIAVRILRTKNANGLAVSTWWLKLVSFTCTDIYNIKKGFPISAFSESLIITLEAAAVLGLVTYYQKRINETAVLLTCAYLVLTSWALSSPSYEWISAAQIFATVLSTSALLPQIKQNFDRGESGDYSPVTSSLASVGCAVRLFTTMELAGGDTLLLLNYGVALVLNLSVLSQVIYYGTQREKKTLATLFLADVQSSAE